MLRRVCGPGEGIEYSQPMSLPMMSMECLRCSLGSYLKSCFETKGLHDG